MSFLNPALLAVGLAAVAIPIVIHLLMRRRRRPVPWGAMRFLMEAYRKQKRRMTLEQLLLLLTRCLLVACIALAIGLPVIGAGRLAPAGERLLVILLDNSLTSTALDPSGEPALARHRAAALDALETLDPGVGDQAALVALGAPAEPLVLPPTSDIEGLRSVVRSLGATDSRADFAGAIEAVRAALDGAEDAATTRRRSLLILSDFRAGSAATDRPLPALASGDAAARWAVLASPPAADEPSNVAVSGIEPLRSLVVAGAAAGSENAQVIVRLTRTGGALAAEATRVRVYLDEPRAAPTPTPVAETVVRWEAGAETASASLSVPLGGADGRDGGRTAGDLRLVRAEIDRDAVASDNVRFGGLEVRRSLRVGLIARGRFGRRVGIADYAPLDWARLALAPVGDDGATGIELSQIEPTGVDAGRLAALDAVVVLEPSLVGAPAWGRLGAFVRDGRLLVVFPDAEAEAQVWVDQFERALGVSLGAGREPAAYDPPRRIEAEGAGVREGLLALLGGEMPELARPVGISRQLPIDLSRARGVVDALLPVHEGSPLLVLLRPDADHGGEGEGDAAGTPGLAGVATTALDMDWTDLPTRPLMVPLMQELVRQGVAGARPDTQGVAGRSPDVPPGTSELLPRGADGRAGATPVRTPMPPVRRAGPLLALDERGRESGLVLVHPDLEASALRPLSRGEVELWLAGLGGADGQGVRWLGGEEEESPGRAVRSALASADDRTPLAWPFVLAAVGLAVLEMFLARWGSHAEAPRGGGVGAGVGVGAGELGAGRAGA